jgi:hypothetical protein
MASPPVQPKSAQRVFERTNRTRPERRSRAEKTNKIADRDNLIQLTSVPSTLNINCQIDVSFPSISSASRRSSSLRSIKSNANTASPQLTINLRREWALVARHPKFGIEYKNYIRRSRNRNLHIHILDSQLCQDNDIHYRFSE